MKRDTDPRLDRSRDRGRFKRERECPRCGLRAPLNPQTDPAKPTHAAFGDLCRTCEASLDAGGEA